MARKTSDGLSKMNPPGLLKDDWHVRKVEATLRVARDEGMSTKDTVALLSFWKQPFPDAFKVWVKENVKSEEDVNRLRVIFAKAVGRMSV